MGRPLRGHASHRHPDNLTNYARQERALQLFLSGMTYEAIAKSPRPDDPDKPLYATKGSAYNAVQDARRRHSGDVDTETMIAVQGARYLRLLQAVWSRCLKGELFAVDRGLQIMRQYEELYGLQAPKRATVEVITESVVDAEIRRLEGELAAKVVTVSDAEVDLLDVHPD